MSTNSLVARAPAKINLALHVGPTRADGFHELATVYQAVDVYDEVRATRRDDGRVSVQTLDRAGVAPVVGVGDDVHHLAVRAAQTLRRRCDVRSGADLQVRKDIPVAAGLAGGSADAAATLVACNALWELGLDGRALLDVAAGIGSDVPFALVGATALGTGRGERVEPLVEVARSTWVLVTSSPGLSTPAVYARADAMRAGQTQPAPRVADELLAAVRSGDAGRLAAGLHNDLQPAAIELRPGLADVLAAGAAAGATAGLISGSGPTVLLLVRDDSHAAAVAATVAPVARAALGEAALRTAHGPVPGAALVSDAPQGQLPGH